jgi:hypothetical protein
MEFEIYLSHLSGEKKQIHDFVYPTYHGQTGKAGVDFPVGNFMSLVQLADESVIVFGGT